MLLCCALLCMTLAAQVSILADDFESTDTAKRWSGAVQDKGVNGRGLVIDVSASANASKGGKTVSIQLPVESVKGKKVTVSVMVKGENVSAKPEHYNGIKVMMPSITASGKKDWPYADLPAGSFDWRLARFQASIPADAVSVSIVLGLEKVSGKVSFNDLSVTVDNGQAAADAAGSGLSGTIIIDAAKDRGAVNPLIFGHNAEAYDGQFLWEGSGKRSPKPSGEGHWDVADRKPDDAAVGFANDIGMKMLRYPGGCGVHTWDWHKAVGPYEERPDVAFGIDEYITFCRKVGAEPLMTVAVYVGTPADNADLVEYCNAPATADHPWAMKRAAGGHKEPYGIRYWEIGNEEDHGTGRPTHYVTPAQRFTAEEYAAYFLECERLMKKVDPSIKMSVHAGTSSPPSDPWNAKVLSIVKEKVDLVAIHTYIPGSQQWMGSTDMAEEILAGYRAVIRSSTGRDIPMAITEFNVSSAKHALRFNYGAALFCADYVRLMLEPANNVLMANYWQWVGAYFGFIRPRAEGGIKMPAYYLFRLWGQHFGSRLTGLDIDAPRFKMKAVNPIDRLAFSIEDKDAGPYAWRSQGADAFTMNLQGVKKDSYPELAVADATAASIYRISFEARVVGDTEKFILGLGLMDKRGWAATQSAIGVEGIEHASDWRSFSQDYSTLPDATGVIVAARIRGTSENGVRARIEVRNLKIVRRDFLYALLTATSSLSADGKTMYVIVFNKSESSDIRTRIQVKNSSCGDAKVWTVNAPSLSSTDAKSEVASETVSGASVVREGNDYAVTLPPHSMSAVEIQRK